MSISASIKRTCFWVNDWFHGGIVRYFYNDLKSVLDTKEKGVLIQQEHLSELLNFAIKNCKFYQQNAHQPTLDCFPITNKTILRENSEDNSIPANLIPGQKSRDVHVQKTSGSTGAPFAIPQDTRKRKRRTAELKFFAEQYGFRSHDKLGQCRVWSQFQSKSKWQSFKENIIPIHIAKMDASVAASIVKIIRKKRIVFLRAYASWYDILVDYLKSGKAKLSDLKTLKVCLSGAEALNENTRVTMRELTGIPIIEAYSCLEAGMLGQQRIGDNNFYLNHSGYIFEFLKLDSDEPAEAGELARIVITDLFNYAFPLIRYDTGDTAIFQHGNVESNGWEYISKLYGRRHDVIYDTRNQPIHPLAISVTLGAIPGIIQYQFIQRGSNLYTIRLNTNEELDIQDYKSELIEILGEDAVIEVEYVNDIPVLTSGKRKPIVNEWIK